jgi:hypothetical protein
MSPYYKLTEQYIHFTCVNWEQTKQHTNTSNQKNKQTKTKNKNKNKNKQINKHEKFKRKRRKLLLTTSKKTEKRHSGHPHRQIPA